MLLPKYNTKKYGGKYLIEPEHLSIIKFLLFNKIKRKFDNNDETPRKL